MRLQGMPYVAGQAKGVLQLGLNDDNSGRVVLLRQNELRTVRRPPAAMVVIDSAPFAHAMIPLLGLGIPTIILDSDLAVGLRAGMEVGIDGDHGLLTDESEELGTLPPTLSADNLTRDGIEIPLRVSVRDVSAARRAADLGAEAVGLLRSEYLLPADSGVLPDRAFYQDAFQAICQAATPLPVTIRLLDLAVDKLPAWLPALEGVSHAFGYQGARLFTHEPVCSVYQAQLSAIDALSDRFDLRVLIPYLGGLTELEAWSDQIRSRLGRPLPLGAMAETPVTALQLAEWFERVDFVALGCNDLMQNLFGTDRADPALGRGLDPYAPALYRFLRLVAETAAGNLERLQLCGVLPQLPGILPLLLGLGFRVFSVEPSSLGYLRRTIAATSRNEGSNSLYFFNRISIVKI